MKKPRLDLHLSKGLGDTICTTPSIRKLYYAYGKKISVLTDHQIIFKNNQYVDQIFRKRTQNHKYHYVDGDCKIACASDMLYGVKEWGSIRGIPPLVGCLEKKSEFVCHPSVFQVFNKIIEIIKK